MSQTTVKNNKLRNDTSLQICRAFDQLKQSLVHGIDPTQSFAPETIFDNLNQIFCRLSDQSLYTTEDVVDLFEIILANYLDLIVTDQLLDLLEHRYAYVNNAVFISLFDSIISKPISDFMNGIALEACQKRYHRILHQLHSSQRLLSYFKNVRSTSNFSRSILTLIFQFLDCMNVKLLNIELKKYQNTLFIPLLTFLDEHFQTNEHPENNTLIEQILKFIEAVTMETLTIPIFINAQYPQVCLRWLSHSVLHATEYTCILHILYNIALHDEGVLVLNEHRCYEKVSDFQFNRFDTQIDLLLNEQWYDDLQLSVLMLTITLLHPSEFRLENIQWSIEHYFSPALSNSIRSRTHRCPPVHLSQLMIVLMKLCTNDDVIPWILKENDAMLLDYVLDVVYFLLHCVSVERTDDSSVALDVLAIIALTNILWSLSFHQRFRDILIKDNLLVPKLVSFQSSDVWARVLPNIYIPRHMSSLKRAIDGLQHNLDPPSTVPTVVHSSTKCCVMICYSHINVDLCQRLYYVLNAISELTLTADFIHSEYLWKDKMRMIDESDLILFLISKDFLYSRSCRQELIYGLDNLKRPYILVRIDHPVQPLEWFHRRITDFMSTSVDNKDLTQLSDEILTSIRERFSLKMNKSTDTKQWSHTEVKQWFTENKLSSKLHEFYDFKNGSELLAHAHAILPYQWTDEYKRIGSRFAQRFETEERLSPYEFSKFFDALQRLNQSST